MVSKKVHIPDLKSDKNVEPRIVSSQSSTAKSKDTSKIASLRRQEEKLAARERRGQRDAQKKTSPAPERRDAMPKRHTQYRSAQRGGQAVSRQSSPERRRTGGYEQNQAQSSQRGGTREPRPATQADASLEDKRRAWSSKNTEGRNSFDSKKFVRLNEKIDEKNSAMPRLKLNIEDFVKPSGERRMDIFGAGKSRDEIKKEREALDRGVGTGTGTAKREGKREGREKPKGHGFNKYANLTNAQWEINSVNDFLFFDHIRCDGVF